MNTYRTTLLIGISFAALSTGAWAQQESATGQAATMGALDEVTVTARRVKENLQDTPVAVTALSAARLESAGVTGTEGLSQMAPSVEIAPVAPNLGINSAATVFIRGIG